MRLFEVTNMLTSDDFYYFNKKFISSLFNEDQLKGIKLGYETWFREEYNLALIEYSEEVMDILRKYDISDIVISDFNTDLILDGDNFGKKIITIPQDSLREFVYVNKWVKFIKENCKPYLEQNPELIPLYRGIKKDFSEPTISDIPTNRMPRDSKLTVHRMLNYFIEKSGKKTNRSNSVFCTGNAREIVENDYGHIYVVFPIGNFSYTWSTMLHDAFQNFDYNGDRSKWLLINKDSEHFIRIIRGFDDFRPKDPDNDENLITAIIKSFKGDDGSLTDAIESKNEIMISGEKILYIPTDQWSKLRHLL